ncbi:peptide/nickel transport system substrate-binding protein [Saccharopolyspora lacisalsi]|uniref:Peptide/nickel transport system substrate-binding protein n=1 Tax=Halosaccharopolyspora lacisalsi TaxID=1000566 RepID=A0A839DUX6_9PSEU|nr:ABC transporter substrate-binding protein [Halosaccharopolyspora lacisalsi]MBA8825792.1 peptide/nickel transport system substrate-binding protein [Halosaccharopolyspora lacisalsi]
MIDRRTLMTTSLATLTLFGAGCSVPSKPGGDGADSMLLADGYEPDSLNPLLGYAHAGAAKFYDGLMAFDGKGSLLPALAAEPPVADEDARRWTVKLRGDVTFHDGTPFDAEDVVATYRAAIDPAYASTISSNFDMLDRVEALDPHTVRFDLKYPYVPWPARMVLGIVPAEKLAEPAPLTNSELNTKPVGTGPYQLVEWRQGERMVWRGNPDYWGGAPAIGEVTVVFATDDNTRAQRVRSGEFDGTVLPPVLAERVGTDSYRTVHHDTADYRAITLPSTHPVTGDPTVRTALNLAANRDGMIDALLGGHGIPGHTPIPPSMDRYHEPTARFAFDRKRAKGMLDAGGWRPGPDGVRRRGGQRAEFTVMYFADDSLRKQLAVAFASDAGEVGIEVRPAGVDRTEAASRIGTDAIVLGGGNPLDPDLQMYDSLHSSVIGTGTYNNPAQYRNAAVDAALDRGRHTTDSARRARYYKQAQTAYVADPGLVYLAFIQHSYVMRTGAWNGYEPVIEPHTHGTTWGPWWNVEDWTPQR